MRAAGENYQGRLQLRVDRVRRVNEQDYESGFKPEDCVQRTPYDIDVMWEEAKRIAGGCHPLVAAYLTAILDAYEEKFREWPAAQRIHHPYLGGLLEHTLSVTKTCLYLADKYDVSKDLLVAGALLHDIGKLEELSTEGATHYTAAGRLLGHIVLGRDIVREWAGREGVFPEGEALPEGFPAASGAPHPLASGPARLGHGEGSHVGGGAPAPLRGRHGCEVQHPEARGGRG